ncbi:MAG: methyltransferase [Bdellovibrionales bacterium]|nr:methyltransferase [Bdellovibrionales bacterium]
MRTSVAGKSVDPWYKTTHSLRFAGRELKFDVPQDVFSTLRIDEGTILMLENLPESPPRKVLDLGCGYGALGLPVAALHPEAFVELVDRDLLAVEWAQRNALSNRLDGVLVRGSLGFDCVRERDFDWILCNVPARIGKPFILHLFQESAKRLNSNGELRVVVIRDLVPIIKEVGLELGVGLVECAIGPRHSVFSMSLAVPRQSLNLEEVQELYLRDRVEVSGVSFERPFDLGGDDPRRLKSSLPLMLDALPRQNAPRRVLCIRSGYGVLPVLCKMRWPKSEVHAFDRDLLALEFTQRNSNRLIGRDSLKIEEGWFFPHTLPSESRFDLITLEVLPSAGAEVAREEFSGAVSRIEHEGMVLGVCLDKLWREWIDPLVLRDAFSIRALAAREGFTVFSVKSRD